jgi:Arc/MetJ-type ribon-helix-helix transcriptional regulator
MSLVQQQQYSGFVKPYVEGSTKEYKELQDRLIKDYDESALMYDSLKEAADNMQSLDADGDKLAKEAAFQKAYGYIEEAAKMGDYENRGRLVRKAIRDFSTAYKPVAEQVAARQAKEAEIDKSNLPAAEKDKLKQYWMHLYKTKGGLQKTDNGYFGYNQVTGSVPKYVDTNAKITEAYKDVIKTKYKTKYDELVASGKWEDWRAIQETADTFIPKNDIKAIISNALANDAEWRDWIKTEATLNNYQKTAKDLPNELQALIQSEGQTLLQQEGLTLEQQKQIQKNPAKLNEFALNSLIENGYLDKESIEGMMSGNANDATASEVIQRIAYKKNIDNIKNLAFTKYKGVERERSTLHEQTAIIKERAKGQYEIDKANAASILSPAGEATFNLNDAESSVAKLANNTIESYKTFKDSLKPVNDTDIDLDVQTIKDVEAGLKKARAQGVNIDITTPDGARQLKEITGREFTAGQIERLPIAIDNYRTWQSNLSSYKGSQYYIKRAGDAINSPQYFNLDQSFENFKKDYPITPTTLAKGSENVYAGVFKTKEDYLKAVKTIAQDVSGWMAKSESVGIEKTLKELGAASHPNSTQLRTALANEAIKYNKKQKEFNEDNYRLGLNVTISNAKDGSNINFNAENIKKGLNIKNTTVNGVSLVGALNNNKELKSQIGDVDITDATNIELNDIKPIITSFDGKNRYSAEVTVKQGSKSGKVVVNIDVPEVQQVNFEQMMMNEYRNIHYGKVKNKSDATLDFNKGMIEYGRGLKYIKNIGELDMFVNKPVGTTNIQGNGFDYTVTKVPQGFKITPVDAAGNTGKLVYDDEKSPSYIEDGFFIAKDLDGIVKIVGQQELLGNIKQSK